MNNPIRGFVQRYYEAPRLRRLSSGTEKIILEIGCGQGSGAEIINDLFKPQRYVGIDLDPRMIERAQKRASMLKNATFAVGDVSNLEFPDSYFDLIVDFGIIHHVPNWKEALAQVHRTLKDQGEFLFEDLSIETWDRGIGIPLKKIADHPYDEMFKKQEFVDELKALGFDVQTHESSPFSFYHFWGRAKKIS
ncbi:MAG: class I SAM-dependent methyltransferase [Gammaproteobacteria bacterium]|nr:class I SAM-dependent methyltransferase [Gammaproteobacteria bacterium]MBT8057566.1 class I SAM-dependent methyltransferase [Gammaproteobacteria bacterium]NNJ80174.1 class I SAM-dependent methyltransferase [Xanthomonadales bacterium]